MRNNNDIVFFKNNIYTRYGSESKNIHPSVVYLRSKTKITPTIQKINFEDDLNSLKEKFNDYIINQVKINKNFNENCICNIDVSSKSVTYGKASFLRYDVYLKLINKNTLLNNKNIIEEFSSELNDKLTELLFNCGIKCVLSV